LFSVEVRKRGKWMQLDQGSGFSLSEAKSLGEFRVGTSARASFRITKAKSGSKKKRFYGRGITGDFYKKGNIFIEKRERRIKSSGEKEQITMKGIQANRGKSIMKKMWGK
jgi:hypothetical protein